MYIIQIQTPTPTTHIQRVYTPQPEVAVQLLLAAPEPLLMLGAPPVAVPMTAWDIAATWLSAAVIFLLEC